MASIKKKKETTIDDLAVMVAKGFDSLERKIEGKMDGLESRMGSLELGQEDIRNKLDSVAYRFELTALEKRVRVLERKVK